MPQLTTWRGDPLPKNFAGGTGRKALRVSVSLLKPEVKMDRNNLKLTLPEDYKMDAATDLKVKAPITAGASGRICRGQLKSADAIRRNEGTEACVTKEIGDMQSLSDEDNAARFMHEVWIMWTLSAHPNIVRLIGYTVSPRIIVMRQYPVDLYRFLHSLGDDNKPLDHCMALYFCARTAAALAAVHEIGAAHRDIKSLNILLEDPPMQGAFPVPVLCDFGLARVPGDKIATRFNGMSMRYAAPEVILRFHMRTSNNSTKDDIISDVYALGVLFWEILSRRVPWERIPNQDISRAVRNGARLPNLDMENADYVPVMINGLVDAALLPLPEARPPSAALASTLTNLMQDVINQRDRSDTK